MCPVLLKVGREKYAKDQRESQGREGNANSKCLRGEHLELCVRHTWFQDPARTLKHPVPSVEPHVPGSVLSPHVNHLVPSSRAPHSNNKAGAVITSTLQTRTLRLRGAKLLPRGART